MSELTLSTVSEAIAAYKAGEFVIIVDDEDRENEGDITIAADHVTPETINFMASHGKGLICLAMRGSLLDRLNIPLMVPTAQNRSGFGTGFTVSIEAANGVSTGISAHDRSHTIKTLIDPKSTPADIAMPGHMFPVRAKDGGVLERRGQTEASVDLAILADLTPAASICEIMSNDGAMARLPELKAFAQKHGMHIISVEALAEYRTREEATAQKTITNPTPAKITKIGHSKLPTKHGEFDTTIYKDEQGNEHVALICGDIAANSESKNPLVRMHSECMTGDAFGSLRCDCGQQLEQSMEQIAREGFGILIYLRQEGRGIGLGNKIRAYALQDKGFDTVDANEQLGFPADAREYDVAAAVLTDLGVSAVRLITNNPLKTQSLRELGIRVTEQLPLIVEPQIHNQQYLSTKQNRMGHHLPDGSVSGVAEDEEFDLKKSDLLPDNARKLDCLAHADLNLAQDV